MNNATDKDRKDGQQQNNEQDINQKQVSPQEYDQLFDEADKERTRKPGSQTNASDQHNNGRGGGK